MNKQYINIGSIPAIIWGEKSDKLFIAVHGNMSYKEDKPIAILADEAERKGYQVLSFDLPEHGDRKNENTICNVQNCVRELNEVINYAKGLSHDISLFACSMGAYFSMLSYKDEQINKCLFLSPVVNMKRIIDNMMMWFNVSEEDLKSKQEIKTPIGQTLYWDYYQYVKENPITKWDVNTEILYGLKDNLCEYDVLSEFVSRFKCNLETLENGEHYFHTDEQLNVLKDWIRNKLK